MSDDPVRTVLATDAGELPMQRYFVQHRAVPAVQEVKYVGAPKARISPGLADALEHASLIVFCPSNPFLSIGPIFSRPLKCVSALKALQPTGWRSAQLLAEKQ